MVLFCIVWQGWAGCIANQRVFVDMLCSTRFFPWMFFFLVVQRIKDQSCLSVTWLLKVTFG